MALIICPECGKEVSDKNEYCIHCGFPLSQSDNNREATAQRLLKQGFSSAENGNYRAAFPLFLKSAQLGNADAQNMVGLCYHDELGIEKDLNLACEWYKKSIEQGNIAALGNIAILYDVALEDKSASVPYYVEAIKHGNKNPYVLTNLAVICMDGKIVAKDYEKSEVLLLEAISLGHERAKNIYNDLLQLMSQRKSHTPSVEAKTWLVLLGMLTCIVGGIVAFFALVSNDQVEAGAISAFILELAGVALYYFLIPKSVLQQQHQYAEEQKRKLLTEGYLCPSCGLRAGHEFGRIEKGLSLGFWGIYSDKLGKTYQCANCGYKW